MLMSMLSFGQIDDLKEKISLIVAVDMRAPSVYRYWQSDVIAKYLDSMLKTEGVCPDVVSGVLYGIEEYAKTPKNFARLVETPIDAFEGCYDELLGSLQSKLPPRGETYYSITSFAKPYSLMSLRGQITTNRTYLAMITDGKYNGNDDYYGEVEYVKNQFSPEGKAEFKKAIKSVQTNYFCEFIEQMKISGGYIQLYEYVPLQQYFALESVLDFPHKIIARRNKFSYVIEFSSSSVENKDYEIQRLTLALNKGDQEMSIRDIKENHSVAFDVSAEDVQDVHLELKSWVKLCDTIYDNTILHPNGSKLQGKEGLVRKIIIEKEPNAMVLGLFPLSDSLFRLSFWTSSQVTAANSWGWILIFVFLAIIVLAIRKSNVYIAKPKETKI